jgi:hypothetical protein
MGVNAPEQGAVGLGIDRDYLEIGFLHPEPPLPTPPKRKKRR